MANLPRKNLKTCLGFEKLLNGDPIKNVPIESCVNPCFNFNVYTIFNFDSPTGLHFQPTN